jgi:tRNA(fMet)-specific endonuclease VapC
MKICIDTCAYSQLGLQPEELIKSIDEAEYVYVPCIVLGELFAGFSMGKHEKQNCEELARFLELPAVDVVTIDAAIADRYGVLIKILRKQGTPIPTNDVWIAATALETGSRLVTYDSHFADIPGLLIIAP